MEILAPAAVVGFLAVPAILALYILKVRRPEEPVASFLLWPSHVADRQANTPWKRLSPSWLLVLQLLIAAALALALLRPGLVGAAGVARTTVVLIDGSPSMQATDESPTRFGAAVARARALAGQLGDGKQMAVVLLGRHAQLLASPSSDAAALRAALSRARPGGEAANLEEGVSVANAVLSGRPQGSVVLLSDGHSRVPAAAPRLNAPLTYESFGRSSDNVAVETVDRTPSGDVFVRVANLGGGAVERGIELRADGRLVDVLPVRVAEGSSAEPVWTRLPAGTAVLEARLTPGDDLPLDDAGWLVTAPPARRKVVLVTPGNGFLARALSLRPDLEVTVVAPADYRPGPVDLSIFDAFVPEGPLPSPALVIAPPPGKGPVPAGGPVDPGGLLPAAPREPLLQYVSLRDVHVQAAAAVTVPPDWRTVMAGANGPLLLVRQGEPRLAQLTFDVHQSDLPLRPAFPILISNLVSHLLPGSSDDQVRPLGQPVTLATAAETTGVAVTDPAGRTVQLRPPFPAVVNDTTRPGVYSVREERPGQSATSRFVVQLQDPTQSRIGPGEAPVVRTAAAPAGSAPRGTREIWPWLVLLALLALAVEWVVFLRG